MPPRGPLVPICVPAAGIVPGFTYSSRSDRCVAVSPGGFSVRFPMATDADCLSPLACLLRVFSGASAHVFAHFLTGLSFLPVSFESSSYIPDTHPLLDVQFANIFSQNITRPSFSSPGFSQSKRFHFAEVKLPSFSF